MLHTLTLIYLLGLAAIGGCICWLMLRSDHSRTAYYFIGNHASLALWLISQLLVLQSVTEHQLWLSYLIGNLGISFTGTFWLLFSISYTGREVSRRLEAALGSFSAVFFTTIMTNPFHGLYYREFGLSGVRYGVLFYVGQGYIYLSMITGLAVIFRICFRDRTRPRGQAVLLAAATLIPLSLNLLTITDLLKTRLAVTPLSFAISGLLVLLATYRYDFLNVNAVAFEDAFNSIAEGLIVFNGRGSMTYMSRAAGKLLGIGAEVTFEDMTVMMNGGEKAEVNVDGRTVSLRRYRCLDERGRALAHLIICSDTTHYYELLERTSQLAEAERLLAIEQERSRIAQEVHDTVGHTLTMITSLARLAGAAADKLPDSGSEELRGYISETEALSRSGVTQLRCSINDLRDDSFLRSVTGAVRMLCDSVRDMETELTVQGTEDERCKPFIRLIYDDLRETITNCLRYSKADRLDVILRFSEDSLGLYVFDNGCGSGSIREGNGLRGIRERTEKAGGSVIFAADEGFRTMISIPLPPTDKGCNGNN